MTRSVADVKQATRTLFDQRLVIDRADVDAVVHDFDLALRDPIVFQDGGDEVGRGDEHVHMAVFPLRERMPFQMKVDPA